MESIKEYFKGIKILYLALLIGQIMISAVFIFMTYEDDLTLDMSFSDIKQLLMLLLFPTAIMVSNYFYNNKVTEGKQLKGLQEKLEHFRSSNIVRWALIEGVNLINLIFFFLSQNYFFLMLFMFGLFFFVLARTSEEKFKTDYKLNSEEWTQFKKETV